MLQRYRIFLQLENEVDPRKFKVNVYFSENGQRQIVSG